MAIMLVMCCEKSKDVPKNGFSNRLLDCHLYTDWAVIHSTKQHSISALWGSHREFKYLLVIVVR
jgi:hypothetical protein